MERKLTLCLRSLLVFATLLFAVLTLWTFRQEMARNQAPNLQKIGFVGQYRAGDGGDWRPWTEGTTVDNIRYPSVAFRGHFDADIPVNKQLRFYVCHIDLQLYKNGEKIASIGLPEELPAGARSAGNGWRSVASPGISRADEIEIVLSCHSRGQVLGLYDYLINEMYVGDAGALFVEYLPTEGVLVVVGLVVLLLAAGLGVVWATLRRMKVPVGKAPLYLALFMASQGVWLMLFTGIVTLLIPYNITLSLLYTISSGMAFLFAALYLVDFFQDKNRRILLAVSCAILALTMLDAVLQATGQIDGYEAMWLLMLPGTLANVPGVVYFVFQMRKPEEKNNRLLFFAVAVLLFCNTVELVNLFFPFVPDTHAYLIGILVFAGTQFACMVKYLRDSILRAKRAEALEKELLQSRITVMLSQIQPHFLYNSLLAIQQLCDENPRRAEAAVRDFACYLRSNLDALSCSRLIPFKTELEHIRHYLALEQIDPASRLQVVYDLRAVDFDLPALTVQPIVENAVRHGIGRRSRGGTVAIATEETDGAVVVTVSDDGNGFDTATPKQRERSHIGLENVRTRLAAQCGGRLVLRSQRDAGTVVTITIPKGEKRDENDRCR